MISFPLQQISYFLVPDFAPCMNVRMCIWARKLPRERSEDMNFSREIHLGATIKERIFAFCLKVVLSVGENCEFRYTLSSSWVVFIPCVCVYDARAQFVRHTWFLKTRGGVYFPPNITFKSTTIRDIRQFRPYSMMTTIFFLMGTNIRL